MAVVAPEGWSGDATALGMARGIASLFSYTADNGPSTEVDGSCRTSYSRDERGVLTKIRAGCDHDIQQDVRKSRMIGKLSVNKPVL